MRFRIACLSSLFLILACGGSGPLEGTWASGAGTTGSSRSISLDQSYGSTITGSGTEALDGGQSRPFKITGTFMDNDLRATFEFPDGTNESYVGSLSQSGDEIDGSVSAAAGSFSELDFVRQK